MLDKPTGIGWNSMTNEVWLTETGKHRIDILNNDGKIVRYIGMRGKQPGEFNFPTHLCIDAEGNAYVVDAMNFRVQIFNKDGELISYFGSNGDATGYFASPKGISVDSYGNIYIVDALFHAVQIFNMKNSFIPLVHRVRKW
ncbi:MAG: 6-bladed beta-propeller [Bacteroidia bacterium]